MPWEELDGMDDMTPEEIMTRAAWSAINDGAWDEALAIEKEPYCREIAAAIKSLTAAGYVILSVENVVTPESLKAALDKHVAEILSSTTDTGS